MAVDRKQLLSHLEMLLKSSKIRDYCPNGLQVAGNEHVQSIVTGVTANQALIDAAIAVSYTHLTLPTSDLV